MVELSGPPTGFQGQSRQVGDLLSFGQFGKETIDALLTQVRPGPELSATLSMLPWQPGVYSCRYRTDPALRYPYLFTAG